MNSPITGWLHPVIGLFKGKGYRHSKHHISADKIEQSCISRNEKLIKFEGFCKLLDCVCKFIEKIDNLQTNEISLQGEINKIRQHKGKLTEELDKWNKFMESWD